MRALLIALLLGVGPLGCSGGASGDDAAEEEEKAQPDPRTLVEVAAVGRGSVGDHLGASAVIESEAQASLVPETQGVVTGIYAEEGDVVTQGQLLAVVASPTLDAAYQRATAELERAEVDLQTAERLFGQGAIARAEVDTAKRALDAAKTAHIEASRTRGFTRLESPIAGTVASRGLRYGELAAGQPAFTIVDLARLRVVVNLPERDLARLRPGLPAKLTSAYDESATGTGVVERVAPVVDAASGTFRVTVRLTGGGDAAPLRPGQFASVKIEVDRHEDVLVVPRRALVWEEGRSYVYEVVETTKEAEEAAAGGKKEEKKEKEGGFSFSFGGGDEEEEKEPELPGPWRKAVRREVKIGFEDGEFAEVLSGVTEGASVVTVGNQALRDGTRVRLPGDPTLSDKGDAEAGAGEKKAEEPAKSEAG
jgi:membrane fusion protein (multidrug efflux system)